VKMERLFGTDGIRGRANYDPITSETGVKLGRAVITLCRNRGLRPVVLVGRDTRASGEMLEYAVLSGVLSCGGEALRAGDIPTPGLAFLVREQQAGFGIMISASHNPYDYNGFKVFSHRGYKLDDRDEAELEDLIRNALPQRSVAPGTAAHVEGAVERYVSFLASMLPAGIDLEDLKVVLDCANGATAEAAPLLFRRIGAQVITVFDRPDGKNINLDCGSQHPEALAQKVLEVQAHVGLAFDGDGDRLISVDEKGEPLTGDQMLAILAKMLKDQGRLEKDLVVSTVMSNLGLRLALRGFGVNHAEAQVGDRHVLKEMLKRGGILGGEDSGHMIFLRHHTTGDGLLSGLQMAMALKTFHEPLSRLRHLMKVFPQKTINVPVRSKPDLSSVPAIAEAIRAVESRLGDRGRVLVRYSGTEPVCRVMVEGEDMDQVTAFAKDIARAVTASIG
jgi:phosphoglucosamine mutase